MRANAAEPERLHQGNRAMSKSTQPDQHLKALIGVVKTSRGLVGGRRCEILLKICKSALKWRFS